MNDVIGQYWNLILDDNMVLFYFFGVLLAVVEAERMRSSLLLGFKYALLLMTTGIVGGISSLAVGSSERIHFMPILFTVIALATAWALKKNGELRRKWQGMPVWIVLLLPFTGIQWLVLTVSADVVDILILSSGWSVGFYLAFILIAAMKEQQFLAEAPKIYKGTASLLIAIGLLTLAVMGFMRL